MPIIIICVYILFSHAKNRTPHMTADLDRDANESEWSESEILFSLLLFIGPKIKHTTRLQICVVRSMSTKYTK